MKKQKMIKKLRNEKNGITLVALTITIIVLIILAGITLAGLTGENGLIKNAGKAKEQTEIDNEKELIEMATIQAMKKDRHGDITKTNIEKSISQNIGNGKTEIIDDDEKIIVKFIDSNRYYEIDNNGNIKKTEIIVDTEPGNIKIGINGENLYGTEISPFEIWCIEDLIEWSQNYKEYVNSYIKLCRTLDFKSTLSYTNSKDIRYGDINGDGNIQTIIEEMQNGKGFIPIDNFSGIFEGNNYEINNIYIYNETAGLFKYASGKIIDLTITGQIISDSGIAAGIIAIRNTEDLTVQNCYNKCYVKGYVYAGGIVGHHNIYSGILKIINCINEGNIESINKYSGGIIGISNSDTYIKNTYNIGNVQAKDNAGGIIANANNVNSGDIKIINCYNKSNINGQG